MKLAIVMIHLGDKGVTERSLASLRSKLGSHEFVLINNSVDDISDLATIVPRTQVIDNRTNVGFARAVNQGIRRASLDPHVDGFLLLNNDAIIAFGSVDRLVHTFIQKKSAGIVAPVLHHSDTLYDWGGAFNPWLGSVKHKNFAQKPKTVLTVEHVAGAAMLIRRDVIDKVGLFDERFFVYFEDLDYCLRARSQGYTIHINPEVVVDHEGSRSTIPFKRTLYAWNSHLLFMGKYLPRTVKPTAILYDLLFYPLIALKLLVWRKT